MYTIGIDLGGTNIAAAVVNEQGEILVKDSTPTQSERDYKAIVEDMVGLCTRIVQQAKLKLTDIHSVGIGSPGIVDPEKGMVVHASNLNFNHAPIREAFQKHMNVPIYLENDANAAALGEYEAGAGKLYKDFVAITLGTGVGSGVIIDHKIIGGTWHGGAEIGHIVIKAEGVMCGCGRKGCWEQYSSATGLIREAKKAAKAHPSSLLNTLVNGQLDQMTAKIPFDGAQAGDLVAQGVITSYIDDLAIGLVNIINIFQPEIIVLGGGVSAQKEYLIEPLKARMVKEIYGGEEMFLTKIEVAQLGNDAGIIGAALLHRV